MEEILHLMDSKTNSSSIHFSEKIVSEEMSTMETGHGITNDLPLPITCESSVPNCNKAPYFIPLQSISSPDTPSTVIIVSGSNVSQLEPQSTPEIDITFVSSSMPSPVNASAMYQNSASSISSPFLLSSSTGLPEPLVPSSPLSPPKLSSSSSPPSSLADLQPLSMMSYQQIYFCKSSQVNDSTSSITSSSSMLKNNLQMATDRYYPSIQSPKTFLQKVKCSETFDFSPSKESPIKPLKSLRRRPPPPPIGSYRHRSYFSKFSNLRKTVLEKSLLGRSNENNKETKKSCPLSGPTLISDNISESHASNVSSIISIESSEYFNDTSKLNTEDNGCKAISDDLAHTHANKYLSDLDSPDKIKPALEDIPSLSSKDLSHVSSEDMSNEEKIISCVSFSKRKRGRPRKNDAQAPKNSNVLLNESSNDTPHRRRCDAIVTRHSTLRRKDECKMKIASQQKRAHKQKMFISESDSLSRNKRHSYNSPQHCSSWNHIQNTFKGQRGKKKEQNMECLAIYQGGFKRSKEFLDRYIQATCTEDILFPHITQEDVCLFKLANQFYKEHKDKTYNIFGQDEDLDNAILKQFHKGQNNTNASEREINSKKSVLELNKKSEELSDKIAAKGESDVMQIKRGRGRPRINRDLQVLPESERKKKKLISSILRELGDQDNAKKLSNIQNTEDVANQNKKPPNDGDTRSVVTFITPRKRPRSDDDEIECMSVKKTKREQSKENPSLFLSFGDETSSCEKNFISFESLIPHSSCEPPSRPSSSEPRNSNCSNSSTPPGKQSGNKETTDIHNRLSTSRSQFMSDHPKCSCMHHCGLKDTYLSPPFKRSSSQALIPNSTHINSQPNILMLGHQRNPISQSFILPFPSASFQSMDLQKHVFPGVGERQPSQPFTLLCHNSSPMYSLVMKSDGLGCYSMANDDKLQSLNKLGQIVLPCVINNFAADQSGKNKSESKTLAEPDRPITLPLPFQAPPPPSSRHHFTDVQETRPSCSPATLTRVDEAEKMLDEHNDSNIQPSNGSHNPVYASNLSTSYDAIPHYSEQVMRNARLNQCLKMTNGNNTSVCNYSDISFNNDNVFNIGNSRHASYNDCVPAKYFLSSPNLYNQSFYNHPRLVFSQTGTTSHSSFVTTKQNQNDLIGQQFSSYMDGSTSFDTQRQTLFNFVNTPGQGKAINNNVNNFGDEVNIHRLNKTVQNEHNSTLWS